MVRHSQRRGKTKHLNVYLMNMLVRGFSGRLLSSSRMRRPGNCCDGDNLNRQRSYTRKNISTCFKSNANPIRENYLQRTTELTNSSFFGCWSSPWTSIVCEQLLSLLSSYDAPTFAAELVSASMLAFFLESAQVPNSRVATDTRSYPGSETEI